jgi:hypothetical protein
MLGQPQIFYIIFICHQNTKRHISILSHSKYLSFLVFLTTFDHSSIHIVSVRDCQLYLEYLYIILYLYIIFWNKTNKKS